MENLFSENSLTIALSPTANGHGLVTLTVTATDSNGYSNTTDFTVIVSPPGAGAGNALSFDSVNDYVEIPYHSDLNSNVFTISVWAKVDGEEGTIRSVVVSRDTSPFSGFMIYEHDNNKWYFQYGNGSGWEGNSCSLIVLHQWTHIAITNDGSQFKGYINGEFELQGSVFVENPSRPLRIGAGATNTTPGDFFNGQIDELRVYQTVLSQEKNSC